MWRERRENRIQNRTVAACTLKKKLSLKYFKIIEKYFFRNIQKIVLVFLEHFELQFSFFESLLVHIVPKIRTHTNVFCMIFEF